MEIKIKLVLITLMISVISFSQEKIIEKNGKEYHTDSRLNDFMGAWEFFQKENRFKIVFIPRRISVDIYMIDILKGYYSYIVNDVKKADTISNMNPDDPDEAKSSAFMESDGILWIKFWDAEFKKNGTARMTFLNEEKTKARWTLGNYEREQINIITEDNPYREIPDGYSVPTEMILEKVEE